MYWSTQTPKPLDYDGDPNFLIMPRTYKCKTCGLAHQPPTGKHCPNRDDIATEQTEIQGANVLPVLLRLEKRMDDMDNRWREWQKDKSSDNVQHTPDGGDYEWELNENTSSDAGSEPASPETIRKDKKLMRQAARRLGCLRLREWDEAELDGLSAAQKAGKKSGSTLTATDKVVKVVDWPHLYVRRMTGGKRKGVAYNDLKVEEFVYGYLQMIAAPKNDMDYEGMMRMLLNLMQDAMEFSWVNARAFYEMIGQDVEHGVLKWSDERIIHEKRMTYARTVFPVRKEAGAQQKPPLTQALPGTKCCIPYQRHSCEQDRDHHPYVHACAYCLKTKTAICRHAEDDCYRKSSDASKNVKQGGSGNPPAQ